MLEISQADTQNPPPHNCPANHTFIPPNLRKRLIQFVHTSLSSGHPGIAGTTQLLHNKFWWKSLQADTISVVNKCKTCAMNKSARQLPAGLLEPLPIPRRPWSHFAVDFVTDLPFSQGNTSILTVIDRFSKACQLPLAQATICS